MLYKLQYIHPIDGRKGYEDYDGKTFEGPDNPADFEAWCELLTRQRRLPFKPARAAGTSRMIEGVPHFFPTKYTTGIHCIRAVPA